MLRRCMIAIFLLSGCDDAVSVPTDETAVPIEYVAASVSQVDLNIIEVTTILRNPTAEIDSNRFSSCMAAGWAQERGYLRFTRLRGQLLIDQNQHDNTVRYNVRRVDASGRDDSESAGLFRGICELSSIPVNDEQLEAARGDNNI